MMKTAPYYRRTPPLRPDSRGGVPIVRVFALVAVALAGWALPAAAQQQVVTEIRQRIEALRSGASIRVSGETVRRSDILVDLYQRRGYTPLWTDAGAADELARALQGASLDGLDPADYHLRAIETLTPAGSRADRVAELDILRSDALVRLTHDLRFGKLDPNTPAAGRDLTRTASSAVELSRMIGSGSLYREISTLRPDHYIYRGLVEALAGLRRIESTGGWERVPDGPSLSLGSVDPRVVALRRRLTTDVGAGTTPPSTASASDTFDVSLELAVRDFQHRHALNEDAVVGPATLAELNVGVAERIDQVRVNLERARWITRDLPATFVAVNIAGARVYYVRGGAVVYESRAIVGQTSTRTPVFQAAMRYIDLNPTWTVPPGIVGEILADVRRYPDYLSRIGMDVVDRQGRTVAISAARIADYSPATFPYYFRQAPGPLNPLGQIKFVFPNVHNVYLHDTPSRSLFDREQRTFSHGCIRLQNPLDLAVLILDDPERWSRADLEEAIADGRTRTISLPTPVPVLILYWTASTDLHGELHFYRDTYARDVDVLRGLGR
jgi:L,D-transpeptidase YcbB